MNSASQAIPNQKWRIAWILFYAYLVIGVVVLYLAFKDRPGGMMPRTVLFFFVPIFAFLAIRGHMTGLALGRFASADRSKEPVAFWMLTSCYWVCTVGSTVVGLGALFGFWK